MYYLLVFSRMFVCTICIKQCLFYKILKHINYFNKKYLNPIIDMVNMVKEATLNWWLK